MTKIGVVVTAVLVGGLLLSLAAGGGGEEETAAVAAAPAQAVGEGMGRSLEDRIRQESERQAMQLAALAEIEDRQATRLETEAGPGAAGAGAAAGLSAAEAELRESLRLEEVERRTRSLRSLPLSRSLRDPDAGTRLPVAGARSANGPGGQATDTDHLLESALAGALASFEESAHALGTDLAAEERLRATLGAGPPLPGQAGPPAEHPFRLGTDPHEPVRLVRPADPPGWERIHEGSFLEAVLVTQLTGDFPGPVLAMVSVPFRSADRQRVLIPRGTRAVGTARAVSDRDQSRLAVAFHRLVLPDGSWIELEFGGLSQAGEGALLDEVDRHYLSTFAAAGAVGVLSGLTLASAPPYGLQAGIGQGLGQGALGILDRFLNRLPTITIRAGHRLRIWLTSDVLVPRPGTRP